MNPCPDRKETLMLDVYGELHPEAARRWEAHLEICARCRTERSRLQALIGRIRGSGKPAALTPEESAAMMAGLHRRVASDRHRFWEPRLFRRALPALAAAAGLILAVWIVADLRPGPTSGPPTASTIDNYRQLSQEDLEVVRNLDLLKQFQTIEKLNRVVNVSGDGQTSKQRNQDASRNDPHEAYA